MRVPVSILLLPGVLGVFYYGWTRRHEFVHDGAEDRRRQGEAARDRLVEATVRAAERRKPDTDTKTQ